MLDAPRDPAAERSAVGAYCVYIAISLVAIHFGLTKRGTPERLAYTHLLWWYPFVFLLLKRFLLDLLLFLSVRVCVPAAEAFPLGILRAVVAFPLYPLLLGVLPFVSLSLRCLPLCLFICV